MDLGTGGWPATRFDEAARLTIEARYLQEPSERLAHTPPFSCRRWGPV